MKCVGDGPMGGGGRYKLKSTCNVFFVSTVEFNKPSLQMAYLLSAIYVCTYDGFQYVVDKFTFHSTDLILPTKFMLLVQPIC